MRTRVKICGITRIEDGIAAAKAGADAIGLVFWPQSPRCVDRDRAREIVAALPAFVTAVGLFVDPETEAVRSVLDAVRLDVLQFHGEEAQALCAGFRRPYVKALPMKPEVDLLQYVERYPDALGLLFDAFRPGGMPGGTGATFDWTRLPRTLTERMSQRVILSGGLNPENVADAVRRVRPWAVDVSSGVEEVDAQGAPRRGVKSASRIGAFIRAVRDADG